MPQCSGTVIYVLMLMPKSFHTTYWISKTKRTMAWITAVFTVCVLSVIPVSQLKALRANSQGTASGDSMSTGLWPVQG